MLAAHVKQLLGLTLGRLLSLCVAALRYFIPIDDDASRSRQQNAVWIAAVRKVVNAVSTQPRDLPVEILPHLLLGDKRSASCLSTLQAFGVTHILNVAGRYGATDNS